MNIIRNSFFKWCSSSLIGHLVLFEIAFGLPLLLVFSWQSYQEGTPTVGWAFWLVFVWAVCAAVGAVAFWFTLSVFLIKRRDKDLS
jgi:hypothetical protein